MDHIGASDSFLAVSHCHASPGCLLKHAQTSNGVIGQRGPTWRGGHFSSTRTEKAHKTPVGRQRASLGTYWWRCNPWTLPDPRSTPPDTGSLSGWPDRWLLQRVTQADYYFIYFFIGFTRLGSNQKIQSLFSQFHNKLSPKAIFYFFCMMPQENGTSDGKDIFTTFTLSDT